MDSTEDPERHAYQCPVKCYKNVSWYCLVCKADLCGKCKTKRLHSKHHILPRTDSEVDEAKTSEPCNYHPRQHYHKFCKHCKKPCCPLCVASEHKGHSFSELKDAANEAVEIIANNLEKLAETILPRSEMTRKAIAAEFEEYKAKSEKAIEDFKHRFHLLREEINRAERDWLEQMEAMNQKDQAEMLEKKKQIDEYIIATTNLIRKSRQLLKQPINISLLSFLSEIPKDYQESTIDLPGPLDLEQWQYDFSNLYKKLGAFTRRQRKDVSLPMTIDVKDIRTIPEIQADLLLINNVNNIWEYSFGVLTQYDESLAKIRSFELDFRVNDMILLSSDDIKASDYDNKRLVWIDNTGSTSTICNTAPFCPWGLCLNDKQQIVVGDERRLPEASD